MKRIILLELCLIFMATAFKSDSPPPGWFIQPIPVNKNITDIYFLDTLNGWAVTSSAPNYDTAYILNTNNGGSNWNINFAYHMELTAIQFLDINTGYTCGADGYGALFKTTNSGTNWNKIISHYGHYFTDLYFINKDTGWVCDNDNLAGIGLQKTTNGGINWIQQLSQAYSPQKLFFINKDTGWIMSAGGGIYRTNNSGNNWMLMYNFGTPTLYNLYFTSSDTGYIVKSGEFYKTVNSGYNWTLQLDPCPGGSAPYSVFMINSNYGYITTAFFKVLKTIDGINWGQQNAPAGGYATIYFADSLKGWVGHGYMGNSNIAATQDGGGPIMDVKLISTEVPKDYKLFQNYPNPFNAKSKIKYEIKKEVKSQTSNVKIIIFDITGRQVKIIVNEEQEPGTYEYNFDASNLSSGIYFYSLINDGIRIDTKKLVIIK